MRQALFSGPGLLTIEQADVPEVTGNLVLVKVEACGICGSDRSIFLGTHPIRAPIVLGHEYAGSVVACGPAVVGLEIGARVTVDPNIVCGQCAFCRRGRVNLCSEIAPLGISRPGGFAEYSLVPEPNAYRIPDGLSFDEAALVEPLACCLRGIHQAGIELGDTVLIFGAGPMGLLLTQLARLRGAASVIVSEPDLERRVVATSLGADITLDGRKIEAVRAAVDDVTGGLGADVVIDASGRTSAASASLGLVRRGGTIVWLGVCPEGNRIEVEPYWVNDAEVTIRGTNLNPFTHQTAITLIERGRVRAQDVFSDTVTFDGLRAAIDPAAPAFRGKVILKPGQAT